MASSMASSKDADGTREAVKTKLQGCGSKGNGTLSHDELRQILKQFLPDDAGASVETLLRSVNANEDTEIHIDHFIDFIWKDHQTPRDALHTTQSTGLSSAARLAKLEARCEQLEQENAELRQLLQSSRCEPARAEGPQAATTTVKTADHVMAKSDGWYYMDDAHAWQPYADEINSWLEKAVTLAQSDQTRMRNWLKRFDAAPKMGPACDMNSGQYVPAKGDTSFTYFSGIVHISETHAVNIFEMSQFKKADASTSYPVMRVRHEEVLNDVGHPVIGVCQSPSSTPLQ
eukprot:TRINITY_DN63220_c0_g1_i1.p1 TRINITY_DN63220_c0_g1~~TRINITY_DN63220_c0_g1_i1.p1  ORF type:complete len:299 (+),score=54.94 TRINITY_DN63220_c0_g1_i1:35-898(+)